MKKLATINRRQFIQLLAALSASVVVTDKSYAKATSIYKTIPKTGEKIPVIGMGTSRTFEDGLNSEQMPGLLQVMQAFFSMGGSLIDSSPMYGSAQQVIGQLLSQITMQHDLFAATKVWIDGKDEGILQMEESRQLWGIKRFDLMQIHNLVDWKTHLKTLQQMKAEGKIRYIGITTSHGRFHDQLNNILLNEDVDFIQLSYNIANREVESSLLPIAQDKGIAVIVNRPYQRGLLFRVVSNKPLPSWTKDFDCHSWGQYFLKFAVSHPAVTCAIPATTKVKHMKDNMQAGLGQLPTTSQRIKMYKYFETL